MSAELWVIEWLQGVSDELKGMPDPALCFATRVSAERWAETVETKRGRIRYRGKLCRIVRYIRAEEREKYAKV